MTVLKQYFGKTIQLELSGKVELEGLLTDAGSDILVIYNNKDFIYIPTPHIQNLRIRTDDETEYSNPPEFPIEHTTEDISYRKMLINAKGLFVEVCISPTLSLHGYLTSIMNDYFVFYSPVFRTVFISLNHLKYLIPYPPNAVPYALRPESFPVKPPSIPLSRSFSQQLKRLEGHFAVLDLGEIPQKIGLFRSVDHPWVELVTADGSCFYWSSEHIKTVHIPS